MAIVLMGIQQKSLALLVLMLSASLLAVTLRPTQKVADGQPRVDLAKMIPTVAGEWREEHVPSALIVDPQQAQVINRIYSQTLTRSYFNTRGYRIMLSIAYGSDQSDSMQVHKPEVCYPAQGFALQGKRQEALLIGTESIPVTRIMTSLGQRSEPVTYWITVGDRAVRGNIHKKLVEMSYGFRGKIPDGMLIRISSIDSDQTRAYSEHDRFAADLISAISAQDRPRLVGHE